MSERGFYGVLEGSDGTGKSEQAIRLTNRLESLGRQVLRVTNSETGRLEPVQEPGGTEESNAIRLRLKDKTVKLSPWEHVELFTRARKLNWDQLVRPALESGRDVITARSFISTIAYQGYGEGIPVQDIIDYTRQEVGDEYMRPDFVAVLALKNELVRRDRLAKAGRALGSDADTFESMPAEFQRDMQDGYVRYARGAGIEIVEAEGPRDVIEGYLWARALAHMKNRP